jgi:hypothetical protein
VSEGEAAAGRSNSVLLRVASGPLAGPLLTRVVAMMLARAQCPVDRLDDAMLICDALGAHAPEHAADGHVEFRMLTQPGRLQLRVGALAPGGARRLADDTALPGVGDVLEPIADAVRVEPYDAGEGEGEGEGEELVLEIGFGRLPELSRLADPRGPHAVGPTTA